MYNLSLSLNTDLLVHLCHRGVQFFTERCNLIGQSFCNVCSYYLFLLRNCFNKSSIKYWTMRMTISKRSVILFTTLQNNSLYYERIYSKPVRYQKKKWNTSHFILFSKINNLQRYQKLEDLTGFTTLSFYHCEVKTSQH